MAAAMRANTITNLNMACMAIENAHMMMLCEALTLNTSVVTIDLAGNAIGETGIVALADACERNTTVAEVNMYENPCYDDASAACKAALQRIEAACTVRPPRSSCDFLLRCLVFFRVSSHA